jgi:hypothetical protein
VDADTETTQKRQAKGHTAKSIRLREPVDNQSKTLAIQTHEKTIQHSNGMKVHSDRELNHDRGRSSVVSKGMKCEIQCGRKE